MGSRHILVWASGVVVTVGLVLLTVSDRSPGPQRGAIRLAPIEGASSRLFPPATPPPSSGSHPTPHAPPSPPPTAQRWERGHEPIEGERWLLSAMLAAALPEPLSEADRVRMADLLLEARDRRGREAPAREREILLALNDEFERIAGEPMGSVASRLSLPGEVPARPPPGLEEPQEAGSDTGRAR